MKRITIFTVIVLAIISVFLLNQPKETNPPVKSVPRPSQPYTVEVPANYDKLLIYFHGSGETIESIKADTQKRPIFERLKSEGYIVAYSNAHGNAWGNQASVNDYKQLSDYLHHKYTIIDTVFLSQSMGGLAGLQTVANGNVPVKCWGGIYPAIDIEALDALGIHPNIKTAFPDKSQIKKHNPIHRTAYDIPMRIYASTGDTIVPTASNTEPFVATNPRVEWVKTVGDHGDQSNFQVDDLASFYKECLAN